MTGPKLDILLTLCPLHIRSRFLRPVWIGELCGKPKKLASSWASRHLKPLVLDGLVEHSPGDGYRITIAGLQFLDKQFGRTTKEGESE